MRRVFGFALAAAGIALLALRREHARGVAGARNVVRLPGGLYADEAPVARVATLVGAVPGALPPLIGWAAGARSRHAWAAGSLFAIVFLWQIPHFMAIAWMYREDYRSAGFPMLPVIEPDGRAHRTPGAALCRGAPAGQPRADVRRL